MRRLVRKLIRVGLSTTTVGTVVERSRGGQNRVTWAHIFWQKILRINAQAYWPVHWTSLVTNPSNILVGVDSAPGYMPGCYVQGVGKIRIGDYSRFGPGIGLITANHDPYDITVHLPPKNISIGNYCWVGMNVVILPGVELGDFTIVGAGSVVTKSFPDGYTVIGGNPARILKRLDADACKRHRNKVEYVGYIPADRFSGFRRRNLQV